MELNWYGDIQWWKWFTSNGETQGERVCWSRTSSPTETLEARVVVYVYSIDRNQQSLERGSTKDDYRSSVAKTMIDLVNGWRILI